MNPIIKPKANKSHSVDKKKTPEKLEQTEGNEFAETFKHTQATSQKWA